MKTFCGKVKSFILQFAIWRAFFCNGLQQSRPEPFFFYISKFCLSKICALKKVSNIEKKWKHKACQIKPSKKIEHFAVCFHLATTYCSAMMAAMVRCPIFLEKNHECRFSSYLVFYKNSKIPNLGFLACK